MNPLTTIFEEDRREFSRIIRKRYKESHSEYKEYFYEEPGYKKYQYLIDDNQDIQQLKLLMEINEYRIYYDTISNIFTIGTIHESMIDWKSCKIESYINKIVVYGIKIIDFKIRNKEDNYIIFHMRCTINTKTNQIYKECKFQYNTSIIKTNNNQNIKEFLLLIK